MISALLLFVGVVELAAHSAQYQPLVKRLSADDIRTRMDAVSDLEKQAASDPHVLADRTVQEALVTSLETENARVAKNTVTFRKTGKNELTEAYSEYYAQVLGLADNLRKGGLVAAPALVARLRRALVFGTYNPDSEFAKNLARDGDPLVPLVLELTQMPDGPSKWNGYALIGELFVKQEARALSVPLSASSEASLRGAARAGLLDPAPDVRRAAISAVVKAKDRGAIPVLERLAQNDPDVDQGPAKYSVRSLATEALRRLR